MILVKIFVTPFIHSFTLLLLNLCIRKGIGVERFQTLSSKGLVMADIETS